jgi:PadR family transcriptional regulator PadR
VKARPVNPTLDQRRAQWLKGVLDLCVLAQLDGGEAYGYELAKVLEEHGFGEIKGGTLYPLLSRLERGALVATVWRASDQGPDRKYYRLTERGRSELEHMRNAWSSFAATATSILSHEGQEQT